MRGKRSKPTSVRLTDEERAEWQRRADAQDVPLSQLLRAALVSGHSAPPEPAKAPSPGRTVRAAHREEVLPGQLALVSEVHHVDDLGADHLRQNNGAMRK